MKDVIEAGNLPHKEKVYLKKSFGDWRVVHPIQKEDGSIDKFVLLTGGSWWILVKTIAIILIILAITFSYMNDTAECRDLLTNLCDYSINISRACSPDLMGDNLYLGGLNLSGIQKE
jgi:hypothetical protein